MEQCPEVSQGVGAGQGLGSGLSALWGLGAGVRASACGFSPELPVDEGPSPGRGNLCPSCWIAQGESRRFGFLTEAGDPQEARRVRRGTEKMR